MIPTVRAFLLFHTDQPVPLSKGSKGQIDPNKGEALNGDWVEVDVGGVLKSCAGILFALSSAAHQPEAASLSPVPFQPFIHPSTLTFVPLPTTALLTAHQHSFSLLKVLRIYLSIHPINLSIPYFLSPSPTPQQTEFTQSRSEPSWTSSKSRNSIHKNIATQQPNESKIRLRESPQHGESIQLFPADRRN